MTAPAGGDPVRDRLAGVKTEVNRVARLLMAEWERAEGKKVNVSYVATFADMATAVVVDRAALLADERTAAAREALSELQRAARIIAMLEPSPNHDECELDIRRRAMDATLRALGADDAR